MPFDGKNPTFYFIAIVMFAFCQPIFVKMEFGLEHLGQGHRVRHSQLCHSMANIYLLKSNNGRKMALTPFDGEHQPFDLLRQDS